MDSKKKYFVKGKESEAQLAPTTQLENRLQTDLTKGSVWKHLFRIASPAVIGQMFNMLYNWIDTFWGGKISTEALAAFSLTFPLFLFAIAVGQMFASGGLVLISNAMGAKNIQKAKLYMKSTVISALLGGILTSLLVIFLGEYILILLGGEGSVLKYSLQYINTLALGMPFLIVYFALNTALVAQGNTKFMCNMFIISAGINMVLDPLFLYGMSIGGITIIPRMGIVGIALATVLVHFLGVIIVWIKVQNNSIATWKGNTSSELHTFKHVRARAREIVKYGMPSFLQIGMAAVGLSIANAFVVRLGGGYAVAGYGIGVRIEQMVVVPSVGLGLALSALVGQNNGAENYKRIQESYRCVLVLGGGLWLGLMLPIAVFGSSITRVFTTDYLAIQVSYFYLGFSFLGFMAIQLIGSSSGVLQGMRKPMLPNIIVTFRHVILPLIFIPLFAYGFGWKIWGVFTALIVSSWVSAIILLVSATRAVRLKIKKQLG